MSARLRALVRETVAIAERGEYTATDGQLVRIGDAIAESVATT